MRVAAVCVAARGVVGILLQQFVLLLLCAQLLCTVLLLGCCCAAAASERVVAGVVTAPCTVATDVRCCLAESVAAQRVAVVANVDCEYGVSTCVADVHACCCACCYIICCCDARCIGEHSVRVAVVELL